MVRGWMDDFRQDQTFTDALAYLWCVEQAAFEAHRTWFNGRQIAVRRGEFVTSVRQMAAAFHWPSSRVHRFLGAMNGVRKLEQRLAWRGAQSPTIVTVCNYSEIQSFNGKVETADAGSLETVVGQSRNSGGTQDNKGNEGNERFEGSYPEGPASEVSPTHARTRVGAHAREGRTDGGVSW